MPTSAEQLQGIVDALKALHADMAAHQEERRLWREDQVWRRDPERQHNKALVAQERALHARYRALYGQFRNVLAAWQGERPDVSEAERLFGQAANYLGRRAI
jgi:hypothetical protein